MNKFILFVVCLFSVGQLHAGSLQDALHDTNVSDSKEATYKYHLAVVAIFQNESPYLQEWLEYYKLIGVEHFYLYNNLSDDDYMGVLKDYIATGQVELIEWPYESQDNASYDSIQCRAYRDALQRCSAKWLAIIDIDEFVVPVKDSDLTTLLKQFESNSSIGGIVVPWVFFGTSHVKTIPPNMLMVETLLLNGGPAANGEAHHIWNTGSYKSIVRTARDKALGSPHYCNYHDGKYHTLIPFSLGQINHYWTRDETYLHQVKIPRRGKWGQTPESVLAWAAGMNNQTSMSEPIKKFIPPLREVMGYSNEP